MSALIPQQMIIPPDALNADAFVSKAERSAAVNSGCSWPSEMNTITLGAPSAASNNDFPASKARSRRVLPVDWLMAARAVMMSAISLVGATNVLVKFENNTRPISSLARISPA